MFRRLLTFASALSFLLCVATVTLWALWARGSVESWEARTRGGTYWQFNSTQCFGVVRVTGWPEPAGVDHIAYTDAASIQEHSMAVLTGGAPGTYTRHASLGVAVFSHG